MFKGRFAFTPAAVTCTTWAQWPLLSWQLVRLPCLGSFPVRHRYFFSLVYSCDTPNVFWVVWSDPNMKDIRVRKSRRTASNAPAVETLWVLTTNLGFRLVQKTMAWGFFPALFGAVKARFHAACSTGYFFPSLFSISGTVNKEPSSWSAACCSQRSVPILTVFISTVEEFCYLSNIYPWRRCFTNLTLN